MKANPPGKLRVFASKPFMRFARRFGIGDEALWETVNGAWDADLGGGLFKFRLARQGEGSSGGARALIAMKVGQRAVLMFGLADSTTKRNGNSGGRWMGWGSIQEA
jgi:hypothetical protein